MPDNTNLPTDERVQKIEQLIDDLEKLGIVEIVPEPMEDKKMNELMKFDGFPVEVIEINGEPMFEIYSTGAALGYTVKGRGGKLYPYKDRIDKICKNAEISLFSHGVNQFMSEPQLYDFMLEARTDKCRAFRKWVTNELLPSIRKTGQYVPPQSSMIDGSTFKGQRVMTFSEIESVSGIPAWYSRYYVLEKCRRGVDFIVLRGKELNEYKNENNIPKDCVNALAIVFPACVRDLYERYRLRELAIDSKDKPVRHEIVTSNPSAKKHKKAKLKATAQELADYVSSMPKSKREKYVGAIICAMIENNNVQKGV